MGVIIRRLPNLNRRNWKKCSLFFSRKNVHVFPTALGKPLLTGPLKAELLITTTGKPQKKVFPGFSDTFRVLTE
jgi:hypothetical protein